LHCGPVEGGVEGRTLCDRLVRFQWRNLGSDSILLTGGPFANLRQIRGGFLDGRVTALAGYPDGRTESLQLTLVSGSACEP
jgi:hypothetical protein